MADVDEILRQREAQRQAEANMPSLGDPSRPPPRTKEPQTWGDFARGAAHSAMDGLSLGGAAEITAASASLFGQGEYEKIRADHENSLIDFRERNPWPHAVARGLGATVSMALGGKLGQQFGKELARNAGPAMRGAGNAIEQLFRLQPGTSRTAHMARGAQHAMAGATAATVEAVIEGDNQGEAFLTGAVMGPVGAAAGRAVGWALGRGMQTLGVIADAKGILTPEARRILAEEGLNPDMITPRIARDFMAAYERNSDHRAMLDEFSQMFQQHLKSVNEQTRQSLDALTDRLQNGVSAAGAAFSGMDDRAARDAIEMQTPGAVSRAEQRHGLILSPGQRAGDVQQMQREEAMRHGAYGPNSQKEMLRFDDIQADSQTGATEQLGRRLTGGLEGDDPIAGAARVGETVRRSAEAARKYYSGEYEQAQQLGDDVRIENSKLAELAQGVRFRLMDETFDAPLERPLNALKAFEKLAERDGEPSFATINEVRKRITRTMLNSNPADAEYRQLRIVRDGIDGAMNRAFERGLFAGEFGPSGSAPAEIIRIARRNWRNFKRTYSKRPKDAGGAADDAGAFLQRVAFSEEGQLRTAKEMAEALFGLNAIGEKGLSVRVAGRLRDILEPNEFQALRRATWDALTRGPEAATQVQNRAGQFTPQRLSQRITAYVSGKGADHAKVLFSKSELMEMRQFAALLRRVPHKNEFNPSKTAYTLYRITSEFASAAIGAIAGQATASATGSTAAGVAAGLGGRTAAKSFLDSMRDGSAVAALRRGIGEEEMARPALDMTLSSLSQFGRGIGAMDADQPDQWRDPRALGR